ncbi:50S ribosomal protein L10 [Blattabacterium cuenoti]|uniref:50S ribosomal protein L10 n=1 Tax=Blattabacterium cuenoti TaxID=1653831 RepID=UPI00163BB16F|nr:50S ribosomal protein L10 [Blattabacterium cuenoti]
MNNKNRKNKEKKFLKLFSILSNNESLYFIDICNLNSNQVSFLRKKFHESNIGMKVVKNTLLKKVLEKMKNKNLDSFFPILSGNTTILFSNTGKGNIPSKIIKNFHIQEKIEKPYLKGAYVQEFYYFGNKDLDLLINFKSKEDLLIDILYRLQFPMGNIILSFLTSTKYKICGILEYLSSASSKLEK